MITEALGGLGSWSIAFSSPLPDEVRSKLGYFGHIAVIDGRVDVAASGDALLTGARYVGVTRRIKPYELGGSGMIYWLGDEDGKGPVIETKLTFTNASWTSVRDTLLALVPAVTLGAQGALPNPSATYTGTHQYETVRSALDTITAAFGIEYRVNGNATIDFGQQAFLYATTPDTILMRNGSGTDMDLVALGSDYDPEGTVFDYSTRIVLLGQSYDDGTTTTFATGSAQLGSVPYKDQKGNPVKVVRLISESGETVGSVAQRAGLQLNRFGRITQALTVSVADYETDGNFRNGDMIWVLDPDSGIENPANEVSFRGKLLHPDAVRCSGLTWPVVSGMTVAFRNGDGVWVDLTPFITYETGGDQITLGDLPKSLTSAAPNPVQDRVNSAPDSTIPNAPTGLVLNSTSVVDPKGQLNALLQASWTAPATNTDGTTITDLANYVVNWRVLGRPQWQSTFLTGTAVDLPALIDTDYEVRVAAQDRSGHTSAFTATGSIHVTVDTTAPNPPADPTVTSYLGQLRIAYAGTDSSGNPMAKDTNRVVVQTATAAGGPWTTTDFLTPFASGVSYATAPYGSNRWVRLFAVDNAGNSSAPSAVVGPVTTVQVADGDVASLSVGKLTAGIMSADVTVSGRFATALTGARREMNGVGFQAYDSSNALLINLDGVNNLLTGIFQTALSGRRLVMGAAGVTGEIDFLAPDGTKTFVRGYTEGTGIEAMQFGIAGAGGNINSPNSLWNRINYNNDAAGGGGVGWANYRANKHEFVYGKTTGFFHVMETSDDVGTSGTIFERMFIGKNFVSWHTNQFAVAQDDLKQRLSIDANGAALWDQAGNLRWWMTSTNTEFWHDGASNTWAIQVDGPGSIRLQPLSPGLPGFSGRSGSFFELTSPTNGLSTAFLRLFTPPIGGGNYGTLFFTSMDAGPTNFRFEFKMWDGSQYIALWGGAFFVASDGALKKDIVDLPVDALSVVKKMKAKKYKRKNPAGVLDGPDEIGLIAQEAPPEIVRSKTNADTGEVELGIDVYAQTTITAAAVAALAARVEALEAKQK